MKIKIGPDGYPLYGGKIGDIIHDDLTNTFCKIKEISPKPKWDDWQGDWYKVDNFYLDGWRHLWEVEQVEL